MAQNTSDQPETTPRRPMTQENLEYYVRTGARYCLSGQAQPYVDSLDRIGRCHGRAACSTVIGLVAVACDVAREHKDRESRLV